eukprot:CAMPEP_0202874150 /NCGR_PEP_ID=MMETSP1391-20130828/24830_1 /ASSEMBLY_ACC=CAM_ASM_000867 /TAXON_ID=1034604 /ORGANISM="Chlamydomonas leiostraca, Strain SAG 11-49" /LENGTH=176 /DNA_ID=CAMNT_0049555527 /DNA_START=208 /DNA_END=735 /DNA_ORIENTATION=-
MVEQQGDPAPCTTTPDDQQPGNKAAAAPSQSSGQSAPPTSTHPVPRKQQLTFELRPELAPALAALLGQRGAEAGPSQADAPGNQGSGPEQAASSGAGGADNEQGGSSSDDDDIENMPPEVRQMFTMVKEAMEGMLSNMMEHTALREQLAEQEARLGLEHPDTLETAAKLAAAMTMM